MNTHEESPAKLFKLILFLCCNLHQCSVNVKCNCYKMMVQLNIEYAATVWTPHGLTNTWTAVRLYFVAITFPLTVVSLECCHPYANS